MPNRGCRVVEHLPHHPKIKALCPATAARSEGDNGIDINESTKHSIVVEHSPRYFKIKGSCPTDAARSERDNCKRNQLKCPTVVAEW